MKKVLGLIILSLSFVSCNIVDRLYTKYDLNQSSFLEYEEHKSLFLNNNEKFKKCLPASLKLIPKNLKFKVYLAGVEGDLDDFSNPLNAIRRIFTKNYKSIKTPKAQMKKALSKMKKLCDRNKKRS